MWELASLLPGVLSSRLSLAAEPGVWGPVNRRAIDALYDFGGLFGDVESGLCHSVLHRRSNHNRERAARADHARRAPAARGQDRGPLRRRALLGVLRDEHVEVLQAALEHGVRKLAGEHRLRARGRPSSEPHGPAGGPCEQAGLTGSGYLDNQQRHSLPAGRLQHRAQNLHGALVVPVVEDKPEHVRVAVAARRYGACRAAAARLKPTRAGPSPRACNSPARARQRVVAASLQHPGARDSAWPASAPGAPGSKKSPAQNSARGSSAACFAHHSLRARSTTCGRSGRRLAG